MRDRGPLKDWKPVQLFADDDVPVSCARFPAGESRFDGVSGNVVLRPRGSKRSTLLVGVGRWDSPPGADVVKVNPQVARRIDASKAASGGYVDACVRRATVPNLMRSKWPTLTLAVLSFLAAIGAGVLAFASDHKLILLATLVLVLVALGATVQAVSDIRAAATSDC